MSTSQDYKWITQRYSELQRKYPNRYVAVKNGRVVASGREFGRVYDAAIRKVKKDFVTGYILSGEPFVLNTCPTMSLEGTLLGTALLNSQFPTKLLQGSL